MVKEESCAELLANPLVKFVIPVNNYMGNFLYSTQDKYIEGNEGVYLSGSTQSLIQSNTELYLCSNVDESVVEIDMKDISSNRFRSGHIENSKGDVLITAPLLSMGRFTSRPKLEDMANYTLAASVIYYLADDYIYTYDSWIPRELQFIRDDANDISLILDYGYVLLEKIESLLLGRDLNLIRVNYKNGILYLSVLCDYRIYKYTEHTQGLQP